MAHKTYPVDQMSDISTVEREDFNSPKKAAPSANNLEHEGAASVRAEVAKSQGAAPKNTMSDLSYADMMGYTLENRISSNKSYPFEMLATYTSGMLVLFGIIWYQLSSGVDDEVYGQEGYADSIFMALQLVISAGFDDSIPAGGLRFFFFLMIFFGLVVFAVLVGFITDAVSQFMESLAIGRTKVAENGHTLILGWNEATLRCVVQISFLRRQYQMLNESKYFGLLYYAPALRPLLFNMGLLERPSTSLAVSDIVIMTDTISKDEMHHRLTLTLAERGINPKRTKLGQNIICRIGDPTNVNDLIRVSTHRAAAILVMMTEQDETEEDESDGMIQNGATLRTCLALRHVLFTNPYSKGGDVHPDLRVILQMTSPSDYVDAACFEHPDGRDIIIPMDLSKFLNSLMFTCAAQPGLSKIILSLLDFEGSAIRRRKAKNLRSGKENEYGDCVGKTFGSMRRQFTTAIFIGILRPSMPKHEIQARGFGLCPDPETIIEEEDLLIFIGPKSNPVHNYSMLDTFAAYTDTAEQLKAAHPHIEENRLKNGATNSKLLQNLLVCGWRIVWQDHPERLHARLLEVVTKRLPGSTVTFLNSVSQDLFTDLMVQIGLKRVPDNGPNRVYELAAPNNGIFVRHVSGDAAVPSVLQPVINEMTIHTVIVLGTCSVTLEGLFYPSFLVCDVFVSLLSIYCCLLALSDTT
jgi:hypothetical protein